MSYFVPNSGGYSVNGLGDATSDSIKSIADLIGGLSFGLPVFPFRATVEGYFASHKDDTDLLNKAKQSRFVLPRSSSNDLVTATRVAENIVAAREAALATLAKAGAPPPPPPSTPAIPGLPGVPATLGGVPTPVVVLGAAAVAFLVAKKLKVF